MIKIRSVFVVCVLLSVSNFSLAAETAVQRLQRFFDEVKSMRAEFTQTVGASGFATVDESKGVFRLQRPNRFRWDYTEPFEQQIIADGKNLWVYDVDMDQVIVKPLDFILGHTPAVLLSGSSTLTEQFEIDAVTEQNEDGLTWVALRPKNKDTGYEKMHMGFDSKDIKAMELIDSFGQITRLQFTNLTRNPKMDTSIFNFSPPEGVDVIGESDILPSDS